ncbi:MAG: hypothetical protein NTW51_07145 [Cyanobacteria bacterium]|nr:hypothetical protein [Cyanobacteriota bacterium]
MRSRWFRPGDGRGGARLREASLRSGESLRMRFRCEPSLPVDVIGLFVLLPAPVL